jgi:hypothetical protein
MNGGSLLLPTNGCAICCDSCQQFLQLTSAVATFSGISICPCTTNQVAFTLSAINGAYAFNPSAGSSLVVATGIGTGTQYGDDGCTGSHGDPFNCDLVLTWSCGGDKKINIDLNVDRSVGGFLSNVFVGSDRVTSVLVNTLSCSGYPVSAGGGGTCTLST